MPIVAWLLIARSSPASTSAASRAIGTPAIVNGTVGATWNASTSFGVTLPSACCHANETRGISTKDDGVYRLRALAKGTYTITARRVGYVRQVRTITVEDGKLMAQATGQQKCRVYPRSDTEFFYKLVDAQLTFEKGDDGSVAKLVLHQNGQDHPGIKIPAGGKTP